MSIIIIGVGNPIMGDDAIGILTVEELRKVSNRTDVIFATAQFSGIPLAEMLIGHERAVIIDSTIRADASYGELYRIKYTKGSNHHLESMHTIGIVDAMSVLERHGVKMPDVISIYAINIRHEQVVSERISDQLARNAADYAHQIANYEGLVETKRAH
jgi:hydrogenase maturation protease